jgi:hypothetical protein
MVDREARDVLARGLRGLASGRLSNFQYEDQTRGSATDGAVGDILHAAWLLYDDLSEHYLVGPHALSRAQRRVLARVILFLKSDLEYQHPVPSRARTLLGLAALLVFHVGTAGLGLWILSIFRRGKDPVDDGLWPFHRAEDLERAKSSWPRPVS